PVRNLEIQGASSSLRSTLLLREELQDEVEDECYQMDDFSFDCHSDCRLIVNYRTLEKKKSFTSEDDDNTDLIRNDLKTDSIVSSSLTESKYGMLRSIRSNFGEKDRNVRRISNRELKKNEAVIHRVPRRNVALPEMSLTKTYTNEDSSIRTVEHAELRRNNIQRNFRNEKETLDRRVNREQTRTNMERRIGYGGRISDMGIRNTEILKMAKIELSEFVSPSVRREVAVLYREIRLFLPMQFSSDKRKRNTIRLQTNRFDRYHRKNRRTTKKLLSLHFDDLSFDRNTGSKLQQPRHERHLLIPKRELKIPLEEMSRMDTVRRSRKSIRNNALDYGHVEETMRERRDGRGLRRTNDQRMNINKNRMVGNFEVRAETHVVLYNFGKNIDKTQTRRDAQNSRIVSSDIQQRRHRLDSLQLNRQRREVSTKRMETSNQPLKNYNALTTNEINRIRFDNSRDSYRRQERRFSARVSSFMPEERIILDSKRKAPKEENREEIRIISNEVVLSNELRSEKKIVLNRILRTKGIVRNGERNSLQKPFGDKQRNTLVTDSDKKLSFRVESRIYRNERSNFRSDEQLRQTRSRNRQEQIRQRSVELEMSPEIRRFTTRSKTRAISDERFVQLPEIESRISSNERSTLRTSERLHQTRSRSRQEQIRQRSDEIPKNRYTRRFAAPWDTSKLSVERLVQLSETESQISSNERSTLRASERFRLTRSQTRQEQSRQRSIGLEINSDIRRFTSRSNSRKLSDERIVQLSETESRISSNERSNLRSSERLRQTRSRSRREQISQRSDGKEMNLDIQRFTSQLKVRKLSDERLMKLSKIFEKLSTNQRNLNSRDRISRRLDSKENIPTNQIDEKERRYTDRRTLSTNRRIISSEHSNPRMGSIFHRKQDSSRIQKLYKNFEYFDSNRMGNRFETRIDSAHHLKDHRIHEASKQSRLQITIDVSKKLAILSTLQTRRKTGKANIGTQEHRISIRSLTNRIDIISKIPSSVSNSTNRENVLQFSASRQRRIVPLKPSMNINKARKIHNVISTPKSSSSNDMMWNIYEYLSSKKSSLFSLSLNVMLGLAIIFASSDEKRKGFIPRLMNPFIDDFFQCTTAH
ncbi:uncharacterized protein NPIL_690751, partial [Nephila pilipes]